MCYGQGPAVSLITSGLVHRNDSVAGAADSACFGRFVATNCSKELRVQFSATRGRWVSLFHPIPLRVLALHQDLAQLRHRATHGLRQR